MQTYSVLYWKPEQAQSLKKHFNSDSLSSMQKLCGVFFFFFLFVCLLQHVFEIWCLEGYLLIILMMSLNIVPNLFQSHHPQSIPGVANKKAYFVEVLDSTAPAKAFCKLGWYCNINMHKETLLMMRVTNQTVIVWLVTVAARVWT